MYGFIFNKCVTLLCSAWLHLLICVALDVRVSASWAFPYILHTHFMGFYCDWGNVEARWHLTVTAQDQWELRQALKKDSQERDCHLRELGPWKRTWWSEKCEVDSCGKCFSAVPGGIHEKALRWSNSEERFNLRITVLDDTFMKVQFIFVMKKYTSWNHKSISVHGTPPW